MVALRIAMLFVSCARAFRSIAPRIAQKRSLRRFASSDDLASLRASLAWASETVGSLRLPVCC